MEVKEMFDNINCERLRTPTVHPGGRETGRWMRHEGCWEQCGCYFVLFWIFSALFAGCSDNNTVGPSVVYYTFDPEAGIRKLGYIVENTPDNSAVVNPKVGYALRSWQGILRTNDNRAAGCDPVVVRIRDSLAEATGGGFHDELTWSDRPKGKPRCGVLSYVIGRRQGQVRVWLIPDSMETTINYVIFLREDCLRN